MPATYDYFDYPSYWQDRKYEHGSEILAIRTLLKRIPKINSLLEIGAGYGRISDSYLFRTKKAILSDPSAHLLSFAREKYQNNPKIVFLQATMENLPSKVRPISQDLVIMVRVLHHLEDLDLCFGIINKLLKKRGYLILEFANKSHLKAMLKELLKGNLTFPIDISTKDARSPKSIKKKTIAFNNYHPDFIKLKLQANNFKVVDILSVSNIRSEALKKILPLKFLLWLEGLIQKPLGFLNFGPSIFVLAQKRG